MSQSSKERRQMAVVLVVNDFEPARTRVVGAVSRTGIKTVKEPAEYPNLLMFLSQSGPVCNLVILDYQFGDWLVPFATVHDALMNSALTRGAKIVVVSGYAIAAKQDPIVKQHDYKVVDDQVSDDDTFEGIVKEYIG